MITRDFRPRTFDEVAGQALSKQVLRSIISKPDEAPRSIILHGSYGSGKTTLARIFARALNCKAANAPCGVCESCAGDIESTPFYDEFDSAAMGSVEKIRDLRDTFAYSIPDGWSVKVLDEAHVISAMGQTALLKVVEEAPPRVFFVFATTHVDKLLRTIRSRSLELQFSPCTREEMLPNLRAIQGKLPGVVIPEKVLDIIVKKSRGHMRDAHMLMDKFLLIGEESFMKSVRSSHEDIFRFFYAMACADKKAAVTAIDNILRYPLAEVKEDYQEVVLEVARAMVGLESSSVATVCVQVLSANSLKVIRQSTSDWFMASFASEKLLQTGLLCLFQMVSIPPPVELESNISRARAR